MNRGVFLQFFSLMNNAKTNILINIRLPVGLSISREWIPRSLMIAYFLQILSDGKALFKNNKLSEKNFWSK